MSTVRVELTGDEQRLLRAMDRVVQKEKEMGAAADRTGRRTEQASRKAGKARKNAFGARAQAELKSFVTGFASISAAIAGVTKLLGEADAARRRFAEGVRQGAYPRAKLLQLAGSEREAERLMRAADVTFGEGRVRSREEAARLTFQLASAGALGERRFFSRLSLIEDAATLAGSAGKIRSAMGARETGTLQALTSKGFAAAGPVPDVTPADILRASAGGAAVGKKLGLSDEELIAAVSVMSQKAPSAEEAGTLVRRMLVSFLKKGVTGRSLGEMIGKVKGMGLSDQELMKWFGRERGWRGYEFLRAAGPDLAARVAAVRGGAETDAAGRRIRLAERDPRIHSVVVGQMARAAEELEEKEIGITRNLARASRAVERGRMRRRGVPEPVVQLTDVIGRGVEWVTGGSFEGMEAFEQRHRGLELAVPNSAEDIRRAAGALSQSSKILRDAGEQMRGGPTLARPDEDR